MRTQSDAEGYTAMTKALRRDPVALYSMLHARRKDLLAAKRQAVRAGERKDVVAINAAMAQLEEALVKVTAHLNEIAAAEEEQMEAEAAQEPAEQAEEPADAEEPAEESNGPDEMFADEGEEVSPEDAETDEVLEEDKPAESSEVDVAMKVTLRREMGEVAADLLDDYAKKIHHSVITFFKNLTEKALDLGTSDPSDDHNSLREQLLTEIGRRGLERVEPHFLEWREGLVKQLMKEVNKMFAVPESAQPAEEKPKLEIPGEPPADAPSEELGAEEEPAEEAPAEEGNAEDAEEPEAQPAEQESLKMPEPKVSSSFITAAQPVSFVIHRDLKPAAARSIKLT